MKCEKDSAIVMLNQSQVRVGHTGWEMSGGGMLFWGRREKAQPRPQVAQTRQEQAAAWWPVWLRQRVGGDRAEDGSRRDVNRACRACRPLQGSSASRGDCRAWRGGVLGSHLGFPGINHWLLWVTQDMGRRLPTEQIQGEMMVAWKGRGEKWPRTLIF